MKDRIITLKNGKEFLIIDVCTYKDVDYCFACEVVNDDTTETVAVIRINEDNGKRFMEVIKDEDIIKNVCEIVEHHYQKINN